MKTAVALLLLAACSPPPCPHEGTGGNTAISTSSSATASTSSGCAPDPHCAPSGALIPCELPGGPGRCSAPYDAQGVGECCPAPTSASSSAGGPPRVPCLTGDGAECIAAGAYFHAWQGPLSCTIFYRVENGIVYSRASGVLWCQVVPDPSGQPLFCCP